MLVARQAGLVELAGQLADLLQSADGLPREATRFPAAAAAPGGRITGRPRAGLWRRPHRIGLRRRPAVSSGALG